MADNIAITAGSGTTVATDDIAGVHHQRVKLTWGADGTANDTAAASGKALPVQGEAAEDAAATGNPVLTGGRYDSSPRTLETGDVGAFAVNVNGILQVDLAASSGSIDISDDYTRQIGKVKIVNDSGTVINPAVASTAYKNLDVDESEDEVVAAAATLYWLHVVNLAATKRYLKFYNATAANVTVGTTTPVLTFPIPTMADTNGAGFAINFGPAGVAFSTALTIAATTGFADNDTGAPGANEVIVNLGYV